MNKIWLAIVVVVVIGLLVAVRLMAKPMITNQPAQPKSEVIKASFVCPDGKNIQAEFDTNAVKLVLPDGRKWDLPQALSASGARYANADETQVFWNKGNSAFIEENGKTTLQDCVTNTN